MTEEEKYQLVARYLQCYIEELTEGKTEAFLAITDIGPEILPDSHIPSMEGCTLVRVSREDYSAAVHNRNNGGIHKLVLLCSESVKRIDSLKDFIECPAIPDRRDVLMKLLCGVFGISRIEDNRIDEYLFTLVQGVPMEIGEMLVYIQDCITEKGGKRRVDSEKLNNEVCRFGIWRKKRDFPKKAQLQKQLRYSKPDFMRKRLEKALEDETLDVKLRGKIETAFRRDELYRLFRSVDLSEVEKYFRNKKGNSKSKKKELEEEHTYTYSYDKLLAEDEQDISIIEAEMEEDYKESQEDKNNTSEEIDPFNEARRIFTAEDEELERGREDINRLADLLDDYGILEEKKMKWKACLARLLAEYEKALARGDYKGITPVMLFQYCENQKSFITAYCKVMAWLLEDEAMNHLCDGTELVEKLQTLFCTEDKGCIQMPFYHPAAGLYFLRLKGLYEIAYEDAMNREFLSDIPYYMVNQEKLWFPVRVLQKDNRLYQLDYTSLKEPGRLKFYEKGSRGANSPVSFRLLNSVIEEYIGHNPYLGELRITIVDMDDFQGLPYLVGRLQKLVNGKQCLLGRIVINIVSLKERDLKRELVRLYNMGMGEPGIYFRFTRGQYMKDSQELDFNKLMEECDLLFFADTDVMYNKGKLVRYTEEPNEVRKRLERFDLEEQALLFRQGRNHVELLWDTLQRIQNGGDAVLSKWSNQELNLRKLKEINDKVQADYHFEAVVISANERLLRHIYRGDNYRISKSRVSGNESIILSLSQQNKKQQLNEARQGKAEISLFRLLDELSGEEDYCRQLLESDSIQDIILEAAYEEGRLRFRCIIETEEAEDEEDDKYKSFAGDLVRYAFAGEGYLSGKFREMLMNELYGRTEDYAVALALYELNTYGCREQAEITVSIQEPGNQERLYYRNTEVMELLDMLSFFGRLQEVDESSVTTFRNYYKKEMLASALKVSEQERLLKEHMRKNMQNMYERIKE